MVIALCLPHMEYIFLILVILLEYSLNIMALAIEIRYLQLNFSNNDIGMYVYLE